MSLLLLALWLPVTLRLLLSGVVWSPAWSRRDEAAVGAARTSLHDDDDLGKEIEVGREKGRVRVFPGEWAARGGDRREGEVWPMERVLLGDERTALM